MTMKRILFIADDFGIGGSIYEFGKKIKKLIN